MHTSALTLCFALGVAIPSGAPKPRTIYIAWSAKDVLKKQDWSGRASISKGRIVRVEKDSGSADSVKPDQSWVIVYGRSLVKNPAVRPRSKGLFLTVEGPPEAVAAVADSHTGRFLRDVVAGP